MYVSAVRRSLIPTWSAKNGTHQHPILVTEPSGYRLRVTVDQVDLLRFRSLAAAGRGLLAEGRCGEGAEAISRALAVWRGPVLPDEARSGEIERYAVRLEAERLALLQERIAAQLCQGRRLELVGELIDLCSQYPLREGFQQQLMLVHYLSGSRVEALGVYKRARRRMVDEAGIEPGPGMRALHQVVLRGAPAPHPHYSAAWCPICIDPIQPGESAGGCECRVSGCRRKRPQAPSSQTSGAAHVGSTPMECRG
nr:AfsR/SARP family transcriptional regulator [Micromonospora sp. HNM0581]